MGTDTPGKGLVLVVDDERPIADLVRLYLTREGFGVHTEYDGEAALAAARRMRPIAIVLDIGLPGIDGLEICRRLREEGDWTPVLFLTARDDEVDRVVGLELGGDDYITKPFSPRELVARIRTVLRRTEGPPSADKIRQVGGVRLDNEQRRVYSAGVEIALTPTEFELLARLMSRPGRVFSREELLASVWGYAALAGTRTVDVHVAQVRGKLGDASPIRTVRGVGYSVEGGAESAES
ncbi:response regulator transcription factor [Longispora fulva]|uniref:DNA-binding response OmpR family regulator n=1 Tax=Longispora fulva TaxID=619741 RepID=A0A8J7KLN0_9ACTN|nr:response regulator transcription factor [Longispora fulva]MBG6139564.1 DNA-binding response OmpR family regulator [Longispora fulva]